MHVKALADEVQKKLLEKGFTMRGKEGYNEGKWILLDFINIVVHIFYGQERDYYMLEHLWADAKRIDFDIDSSFAYND